MATVLLQTLIEYLWSLPIGYYDNDETGAKLLMEMFDIPERLARIAILYGPGEEEKMRQ